MNKQEYESLLEQHKKVCAHEWYGFLRWDCRDILNLLADGQISQGKAIEAIIERKLGFEPRLPEWDQIRQTTEHRLEDLKAET